MVRDLLLVFGGKGKKKLVSTMLDESISQKKGDKNQFTTFFKTYFDFPKRKLISVHAV